MRFFSFYFTLHTEEPEPGGSPDSAEAGDGPRRRAEGGRPRGAVTPRVTRGASRSHYSQLARKAQ